MSAERKQFDIEAIKAGVDLLELASRYTTLIQVSRRGEYAGPCPVCGGEDRFHVQSATRRFYCRHCRPRGGDAIDLVQMVHDVDFVEACRLLADAPSVFPQKGASTATTERSFQHDVVDWQSVEYQRSAHRIMRTTQRTLHSRAGIAGKEYLAYRGLDQGTWRSYGLGYGQTYHPTRRKRLGAIFIPWYDEDGETITAIQHRFIDFDLAKSERYSQKPGSEPQLFGLQALENKGGRAQKHPQTLFIVEGEFNCLSLHQSGVTALSVGSETNVDRAQTLCLLQRQAARYARLLCWFDKMAAAQQLVTRLQAMGPFRRGMLQAVASTRDANELLAAGELSSFLESLLRDNR